MVSSTVRSRSEVRELIIAVSLTVLTSGRMLSINVNSGIGVLNVVLNPCVLSRREVVVSVAKVRSVPLRS